MADLKSVPDAVKWQLAARNAALIPALYDRMFRKEIGDRYDEIEHEVWVALSRTSYDIATELSFPVDTAGNLAKSIMAVMIILYGPDFKNEILDVAEDRSVIVIRRCPFHAIGTPHLEHGENTFHKCMAFTLMSVPLLNKKFQARFVRAMCLGERQCEIKVEPKPEEEEKKS